uniref:Putative transposase (Putative), gypsy type n=1 Tax=Helianthus annuus TaxID=4232 RepID=A0A251TK96_HELAN
MSEEHQEVPASEEGPVPVLRWDLGLFEQIVRSFRFPPEWDARYPAQGQTAADAPPCYITLYEDFFLQGNFRLPATNFLGSILSYYRFHISQMSPPGMVRVRHFEFLCQSHGIEPSVDKFRSFYQLQRTMGFFSFASRGAAKKILLNPPKSFHDWKPKFFFIREEVVPVAMTFREWTEAIPKEDLTIPKTALWYQQLTPTPNRVFGESVLVAAKMSDQWSPNSRDVPVLKLGDQEAQLYQAAFSTFGGSMGVRPLRDDEESWYDQIRGNFMFPAADAFASPPTATEGAQYPKPRPLRSVTLAGKETFYLSSDESVGSSSGELSSWSKIFAGVLRDLGIDPEEKKKKPVKKKKKAEPEVTSKGTGPSRATTAAGKGTLRLRQRDLDDYVIISDSHEGLSYAAKGKTGAGGSKSSGSAGSRNPEAGATPSFPEDEEVEEEDAAAQLIGRKRGRSEATTAVASAPTSVVIPVIGKTSRLRSLYQFSPEIKKKTPEKAVTFSEAGVKRPKITVKPTDTAAQDAAKAAEAQRKVEEARKKEEEKKIAEEKKKKEEEKRKEKERKRKEEEEKKRRAEQERLAEVARKQALEKELSAKKAMDQPLIPPGPEVNKPTNTGPVTTSKGSSRFSSSGASSGGAGGYNPNVIGAKDTVGDIYYKTYTEEERGDAPHQAPWSLKQKDTFVEFSPAREWFLNSFTPAEVHRQRAKPHEMLYRTYILAEANARAANHQIVREWRTMVRERADWEAYRERMLKRIAEFEKSKTAFGEERAKFEADKKAEEWGREGLQKKLHNVEEQLAKEKAEFKRICAQDNDRAYALRQKIVDLEAKVAHLTSKVEEAQGEKAAKQQMEVELTAAKVQLSNKDKDLHAKDVEIAELKRRLNEQIDRCESLEIDLEAEKVKAADAEEARAVSTAALNVAQTNYSEAQGIVDTLVSEAEWMRTHGVVLVANSILNANELDRAVAALTDAARAVGHRGGYLECADHVEQMLGQEFDTSHCSVTEHADAALASAENSYDNLSLPIMELVVESLKKDDWCQRLKAILDPPVTVELSDEEPVGDDGGDGDDDGNDDDGEDDGDDGDDRREE